MFDDAGIGLHGFELGCGIHFGRLFDETNSDCHVSGVFMPTKHVWTHFFALSTFKLCYLDELDDHIRMASTNKGKSSPREIHEIGFKVDDQLSLSNMRESF